MRAACAMISKPSSNQHEETFKSNQLDKWIHEHRRVRKPRLNWAENTLADMWDELNKHDKRYRYIAFKKKPQKVSALKQLAMEQHP